MKQTHKLLIKVILITLLFVPPVRIILDHTSSGNGFLDMIYFGQEFKESVLPEVRAISPIPQSQWGYDGQFYAQIALNPSLTNDSLTRALDLPAYRSRRIGLPFLAFCLGMGKPAWILQIYALLNFGFWLLLLVMFGRFIGYTSLRDILLAVALLWSTGTLISIARSLPDFPAAVLSVLAVFSNNNWITSAVFLGAAGLVKETSVLSFTAVPLRSKPQGWDVRRLIISSLIIILPITLWLMYVHFRLPVGSVTGVNNFAVPLLGVAHKLRNGLYELAMGVVSTPMMLQGGRLFEVLAPLSLITQAIYLVSKPRISSQAWRMGIGFVFLLSTLGESVWVQQEAYCRVLLPLTFSFNLLLHKHASGSRFATWYLMGNVGMCYMLLQSLHLL